MVKIAFHPDFKRIFSRVRDKKLKEKIIKQISKIKDNPEAGKPMKFTRKGTREIHIPPFRLLYLYLKNGNKIIILDLYHKDEP